MEVLRGERAILFFGGAGRGIRAAADHSEDSWCIAVADEKNLTQRNTSICAPIPAQVSSRTSRGVPVRDGMKLWCHSSRLATNAVPSTARFAQRKIHRRPFTAGSVSHHARNSRMLSNP